MLIKTQYNLSPQDTPAHSVVVEDDLQNPIFVATHLAEGIIYSSVGDSDFKEVLKLVGISGAPSVDHISQQK